MENKIKAFLSALLSFVLIAALIICIVYYPLGLIWITLGLSSIGVFILLYNVFLDIFNDKQ